MQRHYSKTLRRNRLAPVRISSFLSCAEEKDPCKYGICDQHRQQSLHDRSRRRLADTLGATFDVKPGVAGNCDDDPCKNRALDHSRIQIPRIRALQGAQNVTSGIEIKGEAADGPASEHADIVSEDC